jgi:hypothetical protein
MNVQMAALQDTMIRGTQALEEANPELVPVVKAFLNMQIVPKMQSLQSLINNLEDSGPNLSLEVLQEHSNRVTQSIISCHERIAHCRGLGPDNWEDPISRQMRAANVPNWRIHQEENKRLNSALYNLATQSFRSQNRITREQQWHAEFDLPADPVVQLALEDMPQEEGERHIQDDQPPPERKYPKRPEMTRDELRQFQVEPPRAPWAKQANPEGVLTLDGRWHPEGVKKDEKDIFYDPEYHREERKLQELRKKHGETQCRYQWTSTGCRKGARCPFKHTEWYDGKDRKECAERYGQSQEKPPWVIDREDRAREALQERDERRQQRHNISAMALHASEAWSFQQGGSSSSSSHANAKTKNQPKAKVWKKKKLQTPAHSHEAFIHSEEEQSSEVDGV